MSTKNQKKGQRNERGLRMYVVVFELLRQEERKKPPERGTASSSASHMEHISSITKHFLT